MKIEKHISMIQLRYKKVKLIFSTTQCNVEYNDNTVKLIPTTFTVSLEGSCEKRDSKHIEKLRKLYKFAKNSKMIGNDIRRQRAEFIELIIDAYKNDDKYEIDIVTMPMTPKKKIEKIQKVTIR